MAGKQKVQQADSIGPGFLHEFLKNFDYWEKKKRRAEPEAWMDDILEVLRSQPHQPYQGQDQDRRQWILRNFSEI